MAGAGAGPDGQRRGAGPDGRRGGAGPGSPPGHAVAAPRAGRLLSVDLARLVALLGMFASHLVLPLRADAPGGVDGLFQVVAGRSSALFALLAGVSLAIVTRDLHAAGRSTASGRTPSTSARRGPSTSAGSSGGPTSAGGRSGPASHRRRLLVRAAAVGTIGLLLGLLDSGIAVILVYYAVLFCCALPVLTWRAPALAALAVGWGLLSPLVSMLIRPALPPTTYQIPSLVSLRDPVRLLSELVVTGYYPVLTWATYLFAGLAVGRLLAPGGTALSDARVPARRGALLTLLGLTLAALPLAASRLITGSEQVRQVLVETSGSGSWETLAVDLRRGFYGVHPEGSPWWLGVWVPHSGSITDLAHTTGCALLVLGLCWWAVRLLPRLPWSLLAGAGAMTLTLYSLHVVVLGSPAGEPGRALARGSDSALALHVTLALAIGVVFAVLRRPGPVEQGVRWLTTSLAPPK
ncbi:heparan-alpha-glucosaminide N-acetyltransferase domain-containing protein [Ornithinimicrobium sufpigmenti]|uniref:heparan-alpha-glucosaminide N-acetyltransferase domain-containing protein n=1 Tax=Ornithinimicrobium sufpigmenti TaxID=2508882 RepID=UPI001035CFEB|nr:MULTISPECIES: heparan-alpha-glucosaminide N-acetyltransferase domain-containing protein [unclassified Ornithinimicrobium]